MGGNTNFSIGATVHFHPQCARYLFHMIAASAQFTLSELWVLQYLWAACLSSTQWYYIQFIGSALVKPYPHPLYKGNGDGVLLFLWEYLHLCCYVKRTIVSHRWAALLSLALLIELYLLHFCWLPLWSCKNQWMWCTPNTSRQAYRILSALRISPHTWSRRWANCLSIGTVKGTTADMWVWYQPSKEYKMCFPNNIRSIGTLRLRKLQV